MIGRRTTSASRRSIGAVASAIAGINCWQHVVMAAVGEAGPLSSRRGVPFVPRIPHHHRQLAAQEALAPTNNLNSVLGDHDTNNVDERISSVSEQECIPTYLQVRGGGATSSASTTEQHILDGGTTPLTTAMAMARSQARLLVVYIPAKGKSSKSKSNNGIATQSLTSKEVARAANRPSKRKKGDKINNTNKLGSFLIWSAENASSSEIGSAMKRLKAKHPSKSGTTSPILLVAYVAQSSTQIDPTTGRPKLQPRVLAQHHGNPPPSATAMAAWLSSLRKRHGKQYAVMQHQKREAELFVERQKGYADSQVEDREREIKAQREEEERLAKEQAEKERKAAMEQRRKELVESLPEEPEAGGDGVVTIALRFADGRRGQRRFDGEEDMVTVFNWVDGIFGLERERVELSTMTGQKKFVWDDVEDGDLTLSDAGLGKMTGLRVVEIEDDDEEEGDEEEEESDGEE